MSKDHVVGETRDQSILFPDTLDEYVTEENPVRFIDAFVDSLDLQQLGFKHAKLDGGAGRPPYDPSDLLKLYVYGYLNQVRSSRKLEKACVSNLEVIWLMKKLAPDFKTISDFRKDNIDCVKPVFKEFVFLCKSLDLFGAELIGIDGSKFKAVNSKDRNFNQKKLLASLKLINEKIERYLKEMEEADTSGGEEEEDDKLKNEKLREKIGKLEQKREEYLRIQNQMKEIGQKEISLTDPESRLMKVGVGHKLDVCCNVESSIDAKNHLAVEYDVTNSSNDQNELSRVAKGTKETLGVAKLDVTADRGFFDADEIKDCIDNGITPYIPEQSFVSGPAKNRGIPTPEFYKRKFVYDGEADAYTCPADHNLNFMYLMSDGKGKKVRVYGTRACKTCPFFLDRCTTNTDGRKIYRGMNEGVVEEMRRRIKADPSKLKIRKELCEHPFGTMKRAFNQGYLLLKGLRKVTGEIGFTMLAYDMRRAINILGTKKLMASLR